MSRDSLLKWSMIAMTVATTALLVVAQGLRFPTADLINPIAIAMLLGAGAWYYRRRGEQNFVAALTALQHVTLFTACYATMMYAGAAIGAPLIDDSLVRFDSVLGVHLPSIVSWSNAHPTVERCLQWAYNSLMWQTPLVICVLGFSGQLRNLRQFVLQFMLGTWACAILFFLFPAAGPFAAYGYEMNGTQARYLEHFQELREGVRTVVTWRGAEGLITFPSFHTIWALLLAWAVRDRKWLFSAGCLLNGAVVIATLTTGWHYFADVCGGVLSTVGVVLLVQALSAWLEPVPATRPDETAVSDSGPQLTDEMADRLLPVPARAEKELTSSST